MRPRAPCRCVQWSVLLLALLTVRLVHAAPRQQQQQQKQQKGPAGNLPGPESRSLYTVFIKSVAPVVSYDGGLPGLAATAVGSGGYGTSDHDEEGRTRRPDPSAPHVRAYAAHIRSMHDDVAASVGLQPSDIVYSFNYIANAFSTRLNKAQVARLRRHPSVLRLFPSQSVRPANIDTSRYLKLPATAWTSVGGGRRAGEGMIIGVVDSGIWPEHPAFAPGGYGKAPARWKGRCETSVTFPRCNNKIIGARMFLRAYEEEYGAIPNGEYRSPRDAGGHGTWCASAAVGNSGVRVRLSPSQPPLGLLSGSAPRARLSVYKSLWGDSNPMEDVMAAVEQAAMDGVDVLNLSLGTSNDNYFTSAFYLGAVQAGVLLLLAAGNSGPPPSIEAYRTLSNVSPFLFTVAASSLNREWQLGLSLGNNQSFLGLTQTGASMGRARRMVNAARARAAKATKIQAWQCLPGSLNASLVRGAVVVCASGGVQLETKLDVVAAAGAVAMVLTPRTDKEPLRSVFGTLAQVTVKLGVGRAIRAYIASVRNPVALLSSMLFNRPTPALAPLMAAFSSAGPPLNPSQPPPPDAYVTNDILKPDITGPGLGLLGATNGGSAANPWYDIQSGTSMSVAVMAGVAALVRQKYPGWSTGMVKSAMMTTARVTDDAGRPIPSFDWSPATPWQFGSGEVRPSRMLDPGLVYDVGVGGYLNFLAGFDIKLTRWLFPRAPLSPISPWNLNQPNIAVANLRRVVKVTRRVTNVGGKAARYRLRLVKPRNVGVVVSPTQFTVLPGQSMTYSVTLRPLTVQRGHSYGSITWTDGKHEVRSQLVIGPVGKA